MALLIDGPPSTMDDLTGHDSQLVSTAVSEGIDVTGKLALAQEEVALEVEELLRHRGYCVRLGQVVATPWLRTWHTFRTLEMVYADAYYNELNDRYASKRDQFQLLARGAYDRLIQAGLGIVEHPVTRAATPDVLAASGGLADDSYYVTMAWSNATGEEGASAVPAVITTAGSTLAVQPKGWPEGASNWNVYVGMAPDTMTRQNSTPIVNGEWTQPDMLAVAGPGPGRGQAPSRLLAVPRMIQRG